MSSLIPSHATGGPDMILFDSAWNFAWSGVSGIVTVGLFGLASQATSPIAQIIAAVGGCLGAAALFLNASKGVMKLVFRMMHYREPEALKAIPDSDDEIPTATGRTAKPKTMRSTRKKPE